MPTASWGFFPSQVITIMLQKTILNLSHLNCLNHAGKAVVSSKQPNSEGQSAFTRHHQSMTESFRIFFNPFLLEQSQDILRQ